MGGDPESAGQGAGGAAGGKEDSVEQADGGQPGLSRTHWALGAPGAERSSCWQCHPGMGAVSTQQLLPALTPEVRGSPRQGRHCWPREAAVVVWAEEPEDASVQQVYVCVCHKQV